MNINAKSLQLFFVDGRPDGMATAEVFNWTGHVLRLPRTQLKQGLHRQEAAYTGVYLLLGEDEGRPRAYIGEAEDVASRLRNHASQKDWWDTAIVITSTANNLHKAHVKYLESRLIEIAQRVGMTALDNGNAPAASSLSEADQANMESFLNTLDMVLPAIRIDLFQDKTRHLKPATESQGVPALDGVLFRLDTPKHGITGTAILLDGEWIVQAGSRAKGQWTGKRVTNTHYFLLHDELLATGILRFDGTHAVFQEDYAFSSPSAAAAIMNGRASNGPRNWREATSGQTYAEWETQNLEGMDLI